MTKEEVVEEKEPIAEIIDKICVQSWTWERSGDVWFDNNVIGSGLTVRVILNLKRL